MHQKRIDEAKKRLFSGELVIFPTETVYGIGGNANNKTAIQLIYQTKKRPFDNPLICHFANIEEIKKNFKLKKKDKELASVFWPGPLTLILEKNKYSKITSLVSNKKNLVGCRIPNNKIALSLLSELNFPLAAPSANIASKTSVTSVNDLDDNLKKIFHIDGGSSVLGLESTVIKTTDTGCKILRLGSLTIEEIKNKFANYEIEIENSILSPGSQLKHYSPKKPIRINVNIVKKNEALLNFGKNKLNSSIKNLNLSTEENLIEASHNFYNYLNILDITECSGIAVAPIPDHDLGKTINDRLKRASHKDE
ncbi:threonylcarbamoyl-AMP synthase [Pelagibacterales bacterium SAG-MED31]|nr:threonylcarbamoyl-AMP synthase [Pelagibacterales bacterium SAG-MED31]